MIPFGPKIFACNHPTSLDPCYIYPLTDNAAILMTQFVFDLKIVGKLVHGCGFIPVKIEGTKSSRSAFAMAINELMKGRNVLIAPEGKMSPDTNGRKARNGAVRLSAVTTHPIVPIGIRHEGEVKMFKIKDQNVRFMQKGETFIKVGFPMTYLKDTFDANTDLLMSRIARLSEH